MRFHGASVARFCRVLHIFWRILCHRGTQVRCVAIMRFSLLVAFWALCMCLMRFLELLPHNSVTFSNLVEGFYAPGEHRCDVCYCTVIGSQFCISCGVSDRFFCVSQRFWCQECVSVAFPSWVEFSAYWHCEEVSCIFLILQIIGRGCGVWWMCFGRSLIFRMELNTFPWGFRWSLISFTSKNS